jgi:hypothetical protein
MAHYDGMADWHLKYISFIFILILSTPAWFKASFFVLFCGLCADGGALA